LVKRVPSAASRTRVIPLAAGAPFFDAHPDGVARRYGITRPYVLATGTLEPRKNLRRLIEAFAGLDPALRESHELVLAGAEGWQTRETLEAIGRNAGLVRALGHVPEADLPSLYAGATIFAYPSLREGFGLPVLEAMAAGVPVLTSDVSSLPEVGGEAVVYADPYSVESIRAGLRQLLEETALRERLAKEGRERAATFRWSDAAKITLEVLEQAAA
jgi:alpha-1,3-rhamnosyl/mannosyltransferase